MAKMNLVPFDQKPAESIDFESETIIRSKKILEKGKSGAEVIIAVIDTGAEVSHPLIKNNIIGGYNFTEEDNNEALKYMDKNGHGTHVAGTIVKVAPKVKLLILKALNNKGVGLYADVISAINFSATWKGESGEKVSIICLSLGGREYQEDLHMAIRKAIKNNISIVVAAGNNGDGDYETDEFAYPGQFNEVIQVGAIDYSKNIAHFSNSNNEIDLVAPGVGIHSAFLNNSYSILSGTSMAAPHIAGALAILRNITASDFERTLTEAELYAQLVKRTYSLGYPIKQQGNGLINLDLIDDLEECSKLMDFGRQMRQ